MAAYKGLQIVLGSQSKYRRALFEKTFPSQGCEFMSADIDEKAIRRDTPEEMTVAIASGKADALLPKLAGREVLLVCCDQVVACEAEVREKPESREEAIAFLESYRSGKGARCVNGVVVHNTKTGRRVTGCECATAYWKPFPDSVIEKLLAEKEIFSTAGGFMLEDPTLKAYVDRVEGSSDAIEGLPIAEVKSLLLRAAAPAATHVLFDMDGLLLDTESAYTVAQKEILARFGKEFTWDLKAKMMGRKALDAAQIMIADLQLQGQLEAQAFVDEREKILDKLFAESALMPGVERLIRHLHKHNVPMAVATSSHRRHFDLKTTLHKELFGLMHHIVTGDMVKESKPHPEIFLHAASLFENASSIEAEQVLVFEDAPNGVEAALAAKMQVCHVPDPNLARDLRGNSYGEVASLEAFKPEEWGLPPF